MGDWNDDDEDEDEYDQPEPSRTIVLKEGQKYSEVVSPMTVGTTLVVDEAGNTVVSLYIPSRRMRIIEQSEAIWMDVEEVLEDVAVAFRKKVTREEFLKAVEGVLHIFKK